MKERRDLLPGETFVLEGDEFKLVKYCDEPNTGLAVVESRGWGFTVPTAILRAAWRSDPSRARHGCSYTGETPLEIIGEKGRGSS